MPRTTGGRVAVIAACYLSSAVAEAGLARVAIFACGSGVAIITAWIIMLSGTRIMAGGAASASRSVTMRC